MLLRRWNLTPLIYLFGTCTSHVKPLRQISAGANGPTESTPFPSSAIATSIIPSTRATGVESTSSGVAASLPTSSEILNLSTASSISSSTHTESSNSLHPSQTSSSTRASASIVDTSQFSSPAIASASSVTASTILVSVPAATSPGSKPLNNTNDPHRCHASAQTVGDSKGNPFCSPQQGESVNLTTYMVTWNPDVFDMHRNVTIRLFHATGVNYSSPGIEAGDKLELFKQETPSGQGFLYLNFTTPFLDGKNSTKLTLTIKESDSNGFEGPTFTLEDDTTPSNTKPVLESSPTPSSTSSSKKLGEKVGAPIGTIAFLALIAIVAFFLWRRYRHASGTGKDYLSQRSQDIHVADGTSVAAAAPGMGIPGLSGRGHKRMDSFHDEPTRGMELQDRHSTVSSLSHRPGPGDENWDWGRESVSGPSSPTGTTRSNVFRDELQRQKSIGQAK